MPTELPAHLPAHLQSVIDTICEAGCQRTNEIIEILETAGESPEIATLSAADRSLVLTELRHIMSVYDRK